MAKLNGMPIVHKCPPELTPVRDSAENLLRTSYHLSGTLLGQNLPPAMLLQFPWRNNIFKLQQPDEEKLEIRKEKNFPTTSACFKVCYKSPQLPAHATKAYLSSCFVVCWMNIFHKIKITCRTHVLKHLQYISFHFEQWFFSTEY